MNMQHPGKLLFKFRQGAFACGILALSISGLAQAEIYKWVDASGHTHYSENKQDAGNAKAQEVKVSDTGGNGKPTTQSWQEQELAFKQRQAQRKKEVPASNGAPRTNASRGDQPVTDASRCEEARKLLPAIKEGRAYHRTISPGTQADANDRNIAENDISQFCH